MFLYVSICFFMFLYMSAFFCVFLYVSVCFRMFTFNNRVPFFIAHSSLEPHGSEFNKIDTPCYIA